MPKVDIIDWLKTSITGIIILGAIGSLLAVGILKLAAILISRFFRPAMQSAAGRFIVLVRTPHYVVKYLRTSTDVRELIVTCTILISCFFAFTVFAFFSLTVCVAGAVLEKMSHSSVTSSQASFMAFSGSFLFFLSSPVCILTLSLIGQVYDIHMKRVDEQAAAQAREDYLGK